MARPDRAGKSDFASAARLPPYCVPVRSELLRVVALFLVPALGMAQPVINVGSKRFTESYILAEIVTQSIRKAGANAVHRPGLGNTAVLFSALRSGSIDVYPEYTGTIAIELLRLDRVPERSELDSALAPLGLAVGVPLGFSNSYALAMREDEAARLGIESVSDLARHPGLRLALSQEFLNRKDGWPALARAYGLAPEQVRGLDHGLAYEAVAGGRVDVIDVYSTDAKIERYRLRVLRDDRGFFPAYEAVLLYRRTLPDRSPAAWRAIGQLEGRIDNTQMIGMNAQAELGGAAFGAIAEAFLERRATPAAGDETFRYRPILPALLGPDLGRLTLQHLFLVFASLVLGVAAGVPLGVWAHRAPAARSWIMGVAGVLQTVPSLALLAFLIAALDRIGTLPAIVALFLYSLLPIVRNTEAGLAAVPRPMRESAAALGLKKGDTLRCIELPLAARTIVAGVKTAAVINVGTATIAAFVGAGGYGERIVAGLAVNDHSMLLAGAVPAAAMALAVQGVFELLERQLTPWAMAGRRGPEGDKGESRGG
jgi:osmoprotectant transport system permease protein